jgi:methylamine dehydrogenase light chain
MKMLSKNAFDRWIEKSSRSSAQRLSRRSLIAKLGAAVVASASLPLLPVWRKAQAAEMTGWRFAKEAQTKDPTKCNYWRYCAGDGYMCSCCGGGPSTCPPGSSPSPTSWIGSCVNPDDGKTYLIAYRDCCGKDACGLCNCVGQEGDMPSYRPQVNNDIIWCFGASSMVYHCSSAALVGLAN